MLLCPHCQGLTAPLAVLSSVSRIDFFQCEVCAKVSERPKGEDGQPVPVMGSLVEPSPGEIQPPDTVPARSRYPADAAIPFPRPGPSWRPLRREEDGL
jgi:hypothetical protein